MTELPSSGADSEKLAAEAADNADLLEVLIVLARYKKYVVGIPLVLSFAALIVSFLIPPTYTSTAQIMPPQQPTSSLGAMLSQLGDLGGLAGAAGAISGLKSPNDLYIGMLESQTIEDNLIRRFKLKERYNDEKIEDARKDLDKATDISSGKSGLISIAVEDEEPQFAAQLANAYVDELAQLTQRLAVGDASDRKSFYEKQLALAKDQLADAEVELRKTQERTGMLQLDGQVQGLLSSTADLKANIAAKEVQAAAMQTFATSKNPDLLRLQEEIRSLKSQLTNLEKGKLPKDGDPFIPVGKLPSVGIQYVRALREVKYREALFEILAKQYEAAKLDEANGSALIQAVDTAVPAEKKTSPKRALIALLGLLGGAVLGVAYAFIANAYERSRVAPESSERWAKLRALLKLR